MTPPPHIFYSPSMLFKLESVVYCFLTLFKFCVTLKTLFIRAWPPSCRFLVLIIFLKCERLNQRIGKKWGSCVPIICVSCVRYKHSIKQRVQMKTWISSLRSVQTSNKKQNYFNEKKGSESTAINFDLNKVSHENLLR